jgi:hypothetical protein
MSNIFTTPYIETAFLIISSYLYSILLLSTKVLQINLYSQILAKSKIA